MKKLVSILLTKPDAQAVLGRGLGLLAAALMSACATVPPAAPPAAVAAVPAQPSLAEMLEAAQQARSTGANERARQQLRQAAGAYPSSKEPWLQLAADFFDAGDYGNAILAAQEVAQRDPQDRKAHSILAIGGLRVATASLSQLRQQIKDMPGDTQTEARQLSAALRESLGEQVLVPAAEPEAVRRPRPVARRAPAAVAKPGDAVAKTPEAIARDARPRPAVAAATAAAAAPSVSPPRTPPVSGAKPSANPFDVLR